MRDDLGDDVALPGPVSRVVSLVPSLTEALAVTVPDRLVGATDWCTHPAGLDVVRVRGTKNPDRAAIVALAPDLVIANQEENRQLDVQRLRAAGVPGDGAGHGTGGGTSDGTDEQDSGTRVSRRVAAHDTTKEV